MTTDRNAKDNERREQVLRAIAEGKLSVGLEWFGIARKASLVILEEGRGRLRAADLLGLTARALHIVFARDLLPRSVGYRNESFALLEGVALELAIKALPSLVKSVGISENPESDEELESKSKAWWERWNSELHDSPPDHNEDSPLGMARQIWSELRAELIAGVDVQIAGALHGLALSAAKESIEQAQLNDKQKASGDPGEPDDPPSVAEVVISQLYELLELGATRDSGLLFVGEDGMVRVGAHQVRDRVGKPKEQDLHEGRIGTTLDDPASPHDGEGETVSAHLADEATRDALEALSTANLVQELRARLLVEEARATGRADQVAARCFEELESGGAELKVVAEREGISQSSLSEARSKLRRRLQQDPLFRDVL